MAYQLEEKIYPIREGETMDDVFQKIAALTTLPFAIESILITKGAIKVQRWTNLDVEPPYGELPYEHPTSLGEAIGTIEIQEIEPDDKSDLNLEALRVIADMLMQSRRSEMAGLAWVVGDAEVFSKWIGVRKQPVRFLELPVITYSELPEDRILLLCGSSALHNVLSAKFGVMATMIVPDRGSDA